MQITGLKKMKVAEYSIINSFDKFDGVIFVLNCIKQYLRIFVYTLLHNKDKLIRNKRKLDLLKYCRGNLYGHRSLNLSLIRGFRGLGVPYLWNRVNKHTKYVILLWADAKDLKRVQKIKRKYPNIKIVTAPTGCKGSSSNKFIESDDIDCCLAASDWHKKMLEKNVSKFFWNKIIPWPSGVHVDGLVGRGKVHNTVLCYYKLVPENHRITQYLKDRGINPYVLEYGKYELEDYYDVLGRVDFVIFTQDIPESQGLAIAEAWARNRPTVIKYNTNEYGGNTCPYLTKEAGVFYKTEKDLFKIIDKYSADKKKFLNQFSPYKFVRKNFSDEASVQQLIKILKK